MNCRQCGMKCLSGGMNGGNGWRKNSPQGDFISTEYHTSLPQLLPPAKVSLYQVDNTYR